MVAYLLRLDKTTLSYRHPKPLHQSQAQPDRPRRGGT